MSIKANLGCGLYPLDGYINFDKYIEGKDINYLDLEELPLELPDSWADELLLNAVLEHLFVNPYGFMVDEIHRILKSDGVVKIILPFYGSSLAHVRFHHPRNYFKAICDGQWRPKNKDVVTSGQSRSLFKQIYMKSLFKGFHKTLPFIKIHNEYWLQKI